MLGIDRNPKRRRDFTKELAHFGWLDARFATIVPANIAHTSAELVDLLRRKGAPETAWIISEEKALDAQEIQLVQAMKHIRGSSFGSVVSCLAGKLAFFHGEEMKSDRLLERS